MTPAEIEAAFAAVRGLLHANLGVDCVAMHMAPLNEGGYGKAVFTTHAYVAVDLDKLHFDKISSKHQVANVLTAAVDGALLDHADNLEALAARIRAWV